MITIDPRRMKRQLTAHEGERLFPYKCSAGKTTIGVGRNLDDVGITPLESQFMLETDYKRVLEDCRWAIGYWRSLTATRKMVIHDMMFNLGQPRLAKFRKMHANLSQRDYEGAAREMLDSRWAQQVGQRALTLAEMMRTNEPKW